MGVGCPRPEARARRRIMENGPFEVEIQTFSRDLAGRHVKRGHTKHQTENLTGALAEFVEARRLAPDDPYIHYLLGKTLLKFGRPREAQASLKQAVDLCARFIDANYQLGLCYLADPSPLLNSARIAFEAELSVYPN